MIKRVVIVRDVMATQTIISPFENIDIIITNERDRTAATVYPGSRIKNGSNTRSIGFWAKNSSNQMGVVTVPHFDM